MVEEKSLTHHNTADLFLSNHCNAAVDLSAHGFEVFHNAQGTALGNALFSTMKERCTSHRLSLPKNPSEAKPRTRKAKNECQAA